MNIELNWEKFKEVKEQRKLNVQFIDANGNYYLSAAQGNFSISCTLIKNINIDPVYDFETNYMADSNKPELISVATQFERTDIVLKTIKSISSFADQEAIITIKIPGIPGSGNGRYIAGGYAFINNFTLGDCIKEMSIVDVDNLLGYGANFVLQTYHDTDVSEENQGWYLWPTNPVNASAVGEIEIDPMGYYGFIPAGLYLKMKFYSLLATNVYCDIWQGKSYL